MNVSLFMHSKTTTNQAAQSKGKKKGPRVTTSNLSEESPSPHKVEYNSNSLRVITVTRGSKWRRKQKIETRLSQKGKLGRAFSKGMIKSIESERGRSGIRYSSLDVHLCEESGESVSEEKSSEEGVDFETYLPKDGTDDENSFASSEGIPGRDQDANLDEENEDWLAKLAEMWSHSEIEGGKVGWDFSFRRRLTNQEIDDAITLLASINTFRLSLGTSDSRKWPIDGNNVFSVNGECRSGGSVEDGSTRRAEWEME
ncbi:hypothetical protein Sjap_025467 [Stephania japonica]|uniref:Uncharacterized protein n=1 Tax=Stephania japonica TaxID=461633 RepID=A0AAP0E1V9_9MAGN